MKANEFISEDVDAESSRELDLYIMNDEELYRRRFMPIILNLRRKINRGVYDHKKSVKLWMYLVDDAAKKYVEEFGDQTDDVKDMFPKETRLQVAQDLADRELENIKQGEYDAPKGTVS
tara:strand:- start:679 stop:1035 length:357 start_codon:yes stop_codon:yes gene_type:complete